MSLLTHDDELQRLADKINPGALIDHADASYEFDNEDPFECSEVFGAGLATGIGIGSLSGRRLRQADTRLFWVDDVDGGRHFFFATRQEVLNLFQSLGEG